MNNERLAAQALLNEPGLKTLIIREGQADKIYENRLIELTGTISAPRLFVEKRKADHDKQGVHVLYNKDKMLITVVLDEREHFRTTVTGSLSYNPDLLKYGINNEDKTYTISDLQKFLRLRRSHFQDKDKNLLIVSNLGKFKAKVVTELEQSNDTRGNAKDNFQTNVKTDLAMDFTLAMPVFKGGDLKTFLVEICFEVRDKNVSVWLESPELQEIIDSEKDKVISEELKAFTDYVIIEQ